MLKQETVEVGSDSYLVTSFPATKALRLFPKVIKIVGPVLKALSESKTEEEANMAVIEALIESVSSSTDLDSLLKELLEETTKGGVKVNFDMEFSADFGKLIKVAVAVIKLNWGSLFEELGTNAQ